METWKTSSTKIAVEAAIRLPSRACGANSIRTGCMIGVASSSGIDEFHFTIPSAAAPRSSVHTRSERSLGRLEEHTPKKDMIR
jgi:hypothetical protein